MSGVWGRSEVEGGVDELFLEKSQRMRLSTGCMAPSFFHALKSSCRKSASATAAIFMGAGPLFYNSEEEYGCSPCLHVPMYRRFFIALYEPYMSLPQTTTTVLPRPRQTIPTESHPFFRTLQRT